MCAGSGTGHPAPVWCRYCGLVATRVIMLNGPSSSGKSAIARCLQSVLPGGWLTLGIDTLLTAMPVAMHRAGDGVAIGRDGAITVGDAFGPLQDAWGAGLAAMAHAGARLVLDEVFLRGAAEQVRWRRCLAGLDVLWVGVTCGADALAGREIARGDRVPGMAAWQLDVVHVGVEYDVMIDTTATEPIDSARRIAAHVTGGLTD